MGCGIDSIGEAADDMRTVACQPLYQHVGIVSANRGGASGANNGYGAFGVEIGATEAIEQCRAVVGLRCIQT